MKRVTKILGLALVVTAIFAMTLTGTVFAANADGPAGPAPNSGDCIPDGSGFDGPNATGTGTGPAPNSGDGIPDGSGF